ncbi:hypothetical protein pb186bvf_003643 [Paramecium bursaria]
MQFKNIRQEYLVLYDKFISIIIIMLFYIIILLVAFTLLWYFVLGAFVTLVKLKLQLGDQAYFMFLPLRGYHKIQADSTKNHEDAIGEFRKIILERPQVKYILTNNFSSPLIIILDQEFTKIFFTDHQNFLKHSFFMHDILGKGLLFLTGQRWKKQRDIFADAFSYKKLQDRIPMINTVVKERIQGLLSGRLNNTLAEITGDVVFRSFFGQDAKNYSINGKEPQVELMSLINDIGRLIRSNMYVFFKQKLFGQRAFKILPNKQEKLIVNRLNGFVDFASTLIDERAKTFQGVEYFLDSCLKEYLKNTSQISKYDMVAQFTTLLFAGTDTTASTSLMTLYYLALYQDAQEEIYQEVMDVVKDSDVKDIHLVKLTKMGQFINEVLRLRNPALCPFQRKVLQDYTIGKLILKKGMIVQQATYLNQVKDDYYDNPMEFNYKRQKPRNDNGFINIPFGAGQRNCIGQHMAEIELKIIISQILKLYKLKLRENVKIRWAVKFMYSLDSDDFLIIEKR